MRTVIEKREKARRPRAERIEPGARMIEVISAERGGKAEEVLRAIGLPDRSHANRRYFSEWKREGGVESCEGAVHFGTTLMRVRLKLGVREGLHLADADGSRVSMRHPETGLVLRIGRDLPGHRVPNVATQIVGCWVIHGKLWTNRSGELCNWPYGQDPKRPVDPSFRIHDGAEQKLTLRQLIERGGVRSTHVGQWTRPYALVPAACGMPVLLHEFKERADDVCVFGEEVVSEDRDVWGPYARWSGRDRVNGEFRRIAERSASPFAFHLHATKQVFPNCTLASSHLLREVGEERLTQVLAAITTVQPERFYRLIDEEGRTHRLLEVKDRTLVYEDERTFDLLDAPENALQTLTELASLELDPGLALRRIPRVVLDSHFYVVVPSLVGNPDGEAHHLSGSEMYRYLTRGADALQHYSRNERLFQLVGDILGKKRCDFYVYPPIAFPHSTQYTFDARGFEPEAWLDRVLE